MEICFKDLEQAVNINSYSKNKKGIDNYGELIKNWMTAIGFANICYKRERIGDHLLFASTKVTGRKILLLGHLDTVFPENTFTQFTQDINWVYGPGVCDMKGGNFVAIEALRKLKQKLGTILNIDFLLVSDEETGSEDSKALLQQISSRYDLCLVFEAAGSNHEIVVGRKGIATFNITITGKAAHAGNHYEQGVNANLAAAHMLIRLTELTNLSLGSTVNVGKINGGIGANTISPTATLVIEARFSTEKEKFRLLDEIKKISQTLHDTQISIEITGGVQRDVMEPNAAQTEIIKEMEIILNEKILTESRGGVSDANIIASHGITTLDGFGPFGDGDHTIDERACKRSFSKRINQIYQLLLSYQMALETEKSDEKIGVGS